VIYEDIKLKYIYQREMPRKVDLFFKEYVDLIVSFQWSSISISYLCFTSQCTVLMENIVNDRKSSVLQLIGFETTFNPCNSSLS
jgi:hypothetical protein